MPAGSGRTAASGRSGKTGQEAAETDQQRAEGRCPDGVGVAIEQSEAEASEWEETRGGTVTNI